MAIKLSPMKGRRQTSQEKAQAQAQEGRQRVRKTDMALCLNCLFLEAIVDNVHADAMWARSSSSEWSFAQETRKMSLMAEWMSE